MFVNRRIPARTPASAHLRAGVLVALAMCASLGCSTQDDGAGERPRSISDDAGPAREVAATGADLDEAAEVEIPELRYELLDSAETWDTVTLAGGHLYGIRSSGAEYQIARLDPETGEVLATASGVETFTMTDHGPLVNDRAGRQVVLHDPETLERRHTIALEADMAASLQADSPRHDPYWLALRRFDSDSSVGFYTQMAAVRLDLERGVIAEKVELDPCGSTSVIEQPGSRLVAAISCAYQVMRIPHGIEPAEGSDTAEPAEPAEPPTSETSETFHAFPTGAQMVGVGGDVWIRWKAFGYLGRLRDRGDAIETLDLNVDGPVLWSLGTFHVDDGAEVWIVGLPADDTAPAVVHRLDPETFTVVGRATVTSKSVTIVDGRGYVTVDGRLARFDPSSVSGGAPVHVVRPTVGRPSAVVVDDDEERAILEAFSEVFDPAVAPEMASPHLEADPSNLEIRQRIIGLVTQLYPDIELVVTAISAEDGRAQLSYSYLKEGEPAFVPLFASMTYREDRWVVDRASVCEIASQTGTAGC